MGVLLEAEALQFFIGDLDGVCRQVFFEPFAGSEELFGTEACGKEIAYHLMTFGYEESFLLAELLLLELVDVFNLIFAYHLFKIAIIPLQKYKKIGTDGADYTDFF